MDLNPVLTGPAGWARWLGCHSDCTCIGCDQGAAAGWQTKLDGLPFGLRLYQMRSGRRSWLADETGRTAIRTAPVPDSSRSCSVFHLFSHRMISFGLPSSVRLRSLQFSKKCHRKRNGDQRGNHIRKGLSNLDSCNTKEYWQTLDQRYETEP